MCLKNEICLPNNNNEIIGYVAVEEKDNTFYSLYATSHEGYKIGLKYEAGVDTNIISTPNYFGFHAFKKRKNALRWIGNDINYYTIAKCKFRNILAEGYQGHGNKKAFRAKYRTILEVSNESDIYLKIYKIWRGIYRIPKQIYYYLFKN
jgi:hypothetical protein